MKARSIKPIKGRYYLPEDEMPKALEQKLRKSYRKQGLKGEDLDHAVYGTMTNIEKGKTPRKKKGK